MKPERQCKLAAWIAFLSALKLTNRRMMGKFQHIHVCISAGAFAHPHYFHPTKGRRAPYIYIYLYLTRTSRGAATPFTVASFRPRPNARHFFFFFDVASLHCGFCFTVTGATGHLHQRQTLLLQTSNFATLIFINKTRTFLNFYWSFVSHFFFLYFSSLRFLNNFFEYIKNYCWKKKLVEATKYIISTQIFIS